MNNTLTCVYCGHAYPEGTPPHSSQILTDHIRVCEKHPLRAAETRLARLRDALAGLIGESDPEALAFMRDTIMALPMPAKEHQVMADAIDVLIAELTA